MHNLKDIIAYDDLFGILNNIRFKRPLDSIQIFLTEILDKLGYVCITL